jgi:hypothetical protein
MISNQGEFALLLKKWQAESSEVMLLALWGHPAIPPFGSLQVRGRIFRLDEDKRFFAVAAAPDQLENMAMVNYAGCRFVYEADPSFDFMRSTEGLRQFTLDGFDEVALITTPEGVKINVYVLKPRR